MEMTLNNMRDEVWATICTLAENEGITFDACLGLTLQVLDLLPQIPVDILFQTQIPLTIAYCPESSIYTTKGGKESSSESELSHNEEDAASEDESAKADKGGVETSSNGQVASDGKEGQVRPQTQDTLTGISQVFSTHEDTDPESDPREKIQSIQ